MDEFKRINLKVKVNFDSDILIKLEDKEIEIEEFNLK